MTSLREAGVEPNANVYAELGFTWRFLALQRSEYPERADPACRTYGPRTRREFLARRMLSGGRMT